MYLIVEKMGLRLLVHSLRKKNMKYLESKATVRETEEPICLCSSSLHISQQRSLTSWRFECSSQRRCVEEAIEECDLSIALQPFKSHYSQTFFKSSSARLNIAGETFSSWMICHSLSNPYHFFPRFCLAVWVRTHKSDVTNLSYLWVWRWDNCTNSEVLQEIQCLSIEINCIELVDFVIDVINQLWCETR